MVNGEMRVRVIDREKAMTGRCYKAESQVCNIIHIRGRVHGITDVAEERPRTLGLRGPFGRSRSGRSGVAGASGVRVADQVRRLP